MNKRQRKKKYKKEHSCNPPSSKHVHKLEDSLSVIINRFCQIVGDMFRVIKNGIDTIRSVPEDEFIEMVGKLTPEQQELAWKIETYAKIQSSVVTYAVIMPDGKWYQKGDMGWFGLSSETEEESYDWDMHFKENFIDKADPDWILTIVDCHI